MSRAVFWICPRCGRKMRGASKYHLKACKGAKR